MDTNKLGSCGPFLGTLNNRCRIIIGTQKGTIILTATQLPAMYGSPEAVLKGLGSQGLGFVVLLETTITCLL